MSDRKLVITITLIAAVVMAGVTLGVTPEQIERAWQVVSGIVGNE